MRDHRHKWKWEVQTVYEPAPFPHEDKQAVEHVALWGCAISILFPHLSGQSPEQSGLASELSLLGQKVGVETSRGPSQPEWLWSEGNRFKCLALLRAQRSAVPIQPRGSIERKSPSKWFSCLEATGGIRTAAKWTGSILNRPVWAIWITNLYWSVSFQITCNSLFHCRNMESFAVSSAYMNPGCLQEIGIIYSICKYCSRSRGRVCYDWSCSSLPSALFSLQY